MRWWQVMPRASGYGFLSEEWPTGAGEVDSRRSIPTALVEWRGLRTVMLLVFILIGSVVVTVVSAQDDDRRIAPNRPLRGAYFSVEPFPTLTQLDWAAFPANPSRPYVPETGRREIFVALTGNDTQPGTQEFPLATIEAALALAQPGDVIWVMPGEYAIGGPDTYEALILDTPDVTLAGWEIGKVTLVPSANRPAIAIQARADDLIIDGFSLRGFRSVGIEFGRIESPQRNLVLKHLIVANVEEGIRAAYGGDGVQPVIDGMLIDDLWLNGVQLIGLQCGQGPCNNLRWENLYIGMPWDTGNDDSGADALAVESGDNVLIMNADITGAEGDGIDLKSTRNVVANVIVNNMGRNGIKLWHGGDVINALVYNTGADAAIVFEAGEYRVLNTLVARHNYGGHSYGMTVAYDSQGQPGRLEIINSVFYENAGAIWVSPSMELVVHNSVFYGSANGVELVYHPLVFWANGLPISAIEEHGLGAHNLSSDPEFVFPGAGYFDLEPNSPLLDAGTTAFDLPPFDLRGEPRVKGQGVDIGPLESSLTD